MKIEFLKINEPSYHNRVYSKELVENCILSRKNLSIPITFGTPNEFDCRLWASTQLIGFAKDIRLEGNSVVCDVAFVGDESRKELVKKLQKALLHIGTQ